MKQQSDYEGIRKSLDAFRNIRINEDLARGGNDDAESTDAVPYTQQDELMTSIMETAKSQFGADFSNAKTPMLYYPKDGDVTLSGEIPGLGGEIKFQFKYKDASGNGCFIWCNYMVLSDETVKKLAVIHGVYKNWKEELSTAEDIKPMSYGGDSGSQIPQSQDMGQDSEGQAMRPGDDVPEQGGNMNEHRNLVPGDDID